MRPADLTGSHAEGTLQISAAAVNDLLQRLSQGRAAPRLDLQPHNTVVVRLGAFYATAELPAVVHPSRSPRVTVRLASQVVAWGLKAVVREPYVEFRGREVTIALDRVPALAPLNELWPHVRQLTFATSPQGLRVGVTMEIAGSGTGTGTGVHDA